MQNLRPVEKAQMIKRYALLRVGSNGKKIGVAALEAEFGRKRGYISKTLLPSIDNLVDGDSPFVTTRQCEAYKITEDVHVYLTGKTLELEGDVTWDELAQLAASEFDLTLSGMGVYKYCMQRGWKEQRKRVLPWLSTDHKEARRIWAEGMVDEDFTAWVDVDEKWFAAEALFRKVKVPAGEDVPTLYCKSKSNIPRKCSWLRRPGHARA